MPGGVFAINAHWFREIGGFDSKMETWGGENVDISLRTWLCGGSMFIVPCSHVGHVGRHYHPYKLPLGYRKISLQITYTPSFFNRSHFENG